MQHWAIWMTPCVVFTPSKVISYSGDQDKKAKANTNALRIGLVNKRNVDEETYAETWTLLKKWCEINPSWDYISHKIKFSKKSDADFNFQKFHMTSHCVEQIRQHRALQQYSAKRHEQAHKTNLKDGWNASNHNLNFVPQVITFQRRILCYKLESSISKPSLGIGRTALQPAKCSLPVLLWLPPWAPSHMPSPNSWDLKTAVMECILMLWLKTSAHYSRIWKTQCTTGQYTAAQGSFWSKRVVTWRIYLMNNCTQWSSVFTMVLRFKLRVQKVNAFLRCVNSEEATAGAEGIDGTTGCM